MKRYLVLILFFGYTNANAQKDSIYITSISWHTALLVPAHCLPDSIWPAGYDYSQYQYLEIGWGDRDFYQTPGFNPWFALKAFLWSTPSAIHIFPINKFDGSYSLNELVSLKLTSGQLQDLCQYLLEQFELNEDGQLIPLQEGIYYNSQFFAGRYAYHFPINSNVWIAQALESAGFSLLPVKYQFTGWLIQRAKNLR